MFHRYFPLYFWFLRLDVCHSLSVPGNSGRSSRKFLGTTEFLTRLRHEASAFVQGSGRTRRRDRPRITRLRFRSYGGQAADAADAEKLQGMRFACPGAPGKETRIPRMVTNLLTMDSIGLGQFVRVRERSRWDRRHRRQSRDGKRRASREASEFQIRVAATDV